MAQRRNSGDGSHGGGRGRSARGRASSARSGGSRSASARGGTSRSGASDSGGASRSTSSARPRVSSASRSRQAPRGQARAQRTVTTQDGRPGRRPARTARTGRGQTARSAARSGVAQSAGRGGARGGANRSATRPGAGNRRGQTRGRGATASRRQARTRRPRYWLRRLVALLLAVALLAGISAGVLSAAVWARNTIRAQDDQAAAHTATTYANPVECTAADLDVTFTSPDTVSTGAGLKLNLTVNNTGSEACLIDVGSQSLGAVITSGEQTIWTSTACPANPASRRLLVAAGTAASATITWDGNVASSECTPADTASTTAAAPAAEDAAATPTDAEPTKDGEAAQEDEGTETASSEETAQAASGNAATAGTYRVRIQLDGTDLTEDRVFVIE
ncbi:MAG: hypothetical protein E7Z95_05225 [Actinomyces succiniciruminis]|nr:hypothetical protein [Actinomyces succiniciruminis]